MKFVLNQDNRNASDEDLLNDLKKVVKELNKETITREEYDENGRFSEGTLRNRFGGWLNTLERAGLPHTIDYNIEIEKLFKNIEEVWLKLGRQPYSSEMILPLSKYCRQTYNRRFGNWRKALEAFIEYINSDSEIDQNISISAEDNCETMQKEEPLFKHQTKRFPSERLKVQVLMRDGNMCKLCGAIVTGDNIHFDHIKPWSKGGETVLENLQVLCETHNLAKGNLGYNPK
jgi:hypothetical protein